MESPNAAIFAIATTGSFILSRLAPEYLLGGSTLLTLSVSFLVPVLLLQLWKALIYPKFFSPLRHLPQPPGAHWFMGQMGRIMKDPSGTPHIQWIKDVPNDGLIYYRIMGNQERVLPTSPKALAEVMTEKSYVFIKPPAMRANLVRVLGMGILFAEGDDHKRQRRILNPAFHQRHVKELYPVFWAKSREMVKTIENDFTEESDEEKKSRVVEVGGYVNRATLDIIGQAGFDKSFDGLRDPNNKLFQTYQKIFTPDPNARYFQYLAMLFPIWLLQKIPTQRLKELRKAVGVIRGTAADLISSKREKMEKNNSGDVDILSVAMKSGEFSDEQLVNQLMTFLAAGHETTASSMQWAIVALCKYPEIQKKLRQAILDADLPSIWDEDSTVSVTDIEKIHYLSAFCMEVFRYFPPVRMTMRQAAKNSSILGQFIPKGTFVIIPSVAYNHSEEFWGPDAAEFNPERWMAENQANTGGAKSHYAMMTFIQGPRSCIGQGFAKAEFMCLVAAWVLAFDTEFENKDFKIDYASGVTSKPKGGLKVILNQVK